MTLRIDLLVIHGFSSGSPPYLAIGENSLESEYTFLHF